MDAWNEKLKGFLYYIPGCERIEIVIEDKTEFKGPISELPQIYFDLEVEELRGKVVNYNGAKSHYMRFTGHFPSPKNK